MTDWTDPRAVVLWLIAENMYNDAKNADGQPFTGLTIGTHLGYLQAAVMALAGIVASLLPRPPEPSDA